ncbi:MAG: DUF1844 domain-containing protein [Deltaproteobacteria bacterium]|nr:DUF1844 domain-containing protein [Deltaproteobacteria bacterium]MBW1928658.1 DUF1844 domain-containing protein [Deltaproteobacteria bacterium]MBW2025807.1 DUF1844 domain-containing protein [Deltaproteobacteria bacterium]MBW2125943.1 DUF1844 domain-containing protein [Deltaproteobacteria bacterium]RLB14251.1 MAG: DUF1844 domain-containing protein [Deltaproteobacteria bacterium]
MAEEEKGFIIKDKRALDEKGELKQKHKQEEKKGPKAQERAEPKKEGSKSQQQPPLPEVNFTSLIFSLSSSALYHFGEVADPQTGEKKKDLALAKHAIDTIAMLKEKTKGNLTKEEEKFIDTVLADLRWRYVKEVG